MSRAEWYVEDPEKLNSRTPRNVVFRMHMQAKIGNGIKNLFTEIGGEMEKS